MGTNDGRDIFDEKGGCPISFTDHKKKISERRKAESKKYTFVHNDGRIFTGTTGDLAIITGAHPAEAWKLAVGHYKKHKGWKLSEKQINTC